MTTIIPEGRPGESMLLNQTRLRAGVPVAIRDEDLDILRANGVAFMIADPPHPLASSPVTPSTSTDRPTRRTPGAPAPVPVVPVESPADNSAESDTP